MTEKVDLGELVLRIAGDSAQLKRELTERSKDIQKFSQDGDKHVGALQSGFGRAALAIRGHLGIIGAGLAAAFSVGGLLKVSQWVDEIQKMSQSIGVTTEELSGLAYAGQLADLSLGEISATSRRLNQSLAETARFGSEGEIAWTTMGIAVRDAAGQLRPTVDILADMADKFEMWEDGAEKSAIATQVLGRSGAAMIPLLNQGSQAIRDTFEEGRKMGVVFGGETGKRMEEFNDSITRLGNEVKGVGIDILNFVAGPMTQLMDGLREGTHAIREAGKGVGDSVGFWASELKTLNERHEKLREEMKEMEKQKEPYPADWLTRWTNLHRELSGVDEMMEKIRGQMQKDLGGTFTTKVNFEKGKAPNADATQEARRIAEMQQKADAAMAANQAMQQFEQQGESLSTVLEALATPYDELMQKQIALNQAMATGGLTAKQYGEYQVIALAQTAEAYAETGSKVTGALATIFNKSKGFAVADAVMNAYKAFNSALANPPGPPFSYVNAAAALASGFAQVRNIMSTNPGSTGGGASSAGAASSGGGAAGGTAPAAGAPSSSVFVQGFKPDEWFKGEGMNILMEQIVARQREGATILWSSP